MRHRRVVAAVLALAFGCRPGPDLETLEVDALLGSSKLWSDTTLVDFGTESAAPYLLEGWSSDEGDFTWAVGERSSLRVFVGTQGPRTLIARVAPLSWPGAPPQSVTVSIDGTRLAHETLGAGPTELRWQLPAELLPPGLHRIDIEHGRADRPNDVLPGSLDRRRLAMAWHDLRLEGAPAAQAPALVPSDAGPALRVPRGARIEFYAEAEPPASVEIGVPDAAPSSSVQMRIEGDRGGLLWEGTIEGGGRRRIPLPLEARDVLRIGIDTIAAGSADAGEDAVDVTLALRAHRAIPAAPDPAGPGLEAMASAPAAAAVAGARGPNVLVFLVDCLRADHLGVYGYERPTSPHMDAFAAEATVYLDAQAASSWTRTTVASIFTGLMPSAHGVQGPHDALAPEFDTLAEQLRSGGYQTGAVFTNGNIAPEFGTGQGFDTYLHLKEDARRPTLHAGAHEAVAEAARWLDARDPGRPFFLYLHATDPHGPYLPPEPYASRFAPTVTDPAIGTLAFLSDLGGARFPDPERFRQPLIDLYDGEIAFTDAQFGRLIEDLRARGVLDDTLVVLVADHGEEFYDHGWWEHGKTLFVEQLHVPLVIRFPGGAGAGRRVEAPVHQIDLLPTLLAAAGLSPAMPVTGLDVAALAGADAATPERSLRAELDRDGRRIHALLADRWKLINYRAGSSHPEGRTPRSMLFDRVEDPREQHNLYLERPVLAGFFRLALDGILAALAPTPAAPAAQVDEETEANLRALGYLE